jgi:hypothetical protein
MVDDPSFFAIERVLTAPQPFSRVSAKAASTIASPVKKSLCAINPLL